MIPSVRESKSRVFRKEEKEGPKRKSRKRRGEERKVERGKERTGFLSPSRQEPRLSLDSLQKNSKPRWQSRTDCGDRRQMVAHPDRSFVLLAFFCSCLIFSRFLISHLFLLDLVWRLEPLKWR